MSLHIFHFVQERIEESRERLITDKKKIHVWSKRMHLGLKAYKVYIYIFNSFVCHIYLNCYNNLFYLGINGNTFDDVPK